jgi:nitroreductase
MEALLALEARRSVRSCKPDPVPTKIVEDIDDCGRLAATARNRRPWEFVAVTDAPTQRKLAELIDTGRFLTESPVCVAVLCKGTTDYLEDGSTAIENMLVAARARGLGSCWVAGDKKPLVAMDTVAISALAPIAAVSQVGALSRSRGTHCVPLRRSERGRRPRLPSAGRALSGRL